MVENSHHDKCVYSIGYACGLDNAIFDGSVKFKSERDFLDNDSIIWQKEDERVCVEVREEVTLKGQSSLERKELKYVQT